jgi:hypothetical protein
VDKVLIFFTVYGDQFWNMRSYVYVGGFIWLNISQYRDHWFVLVNSNEFMNFIKAWIFLDYLKGYYLLRELN